VAAGFLSGKYKKGQPEPESARMEGIRRRYFNDRGWTILEAAEKVAANNNKTVSQVALAWLLNDPIITSPITAQHRTASG
jgi:aryl-alcohol dehydrogenase-like predicted oxidoreductase